MWSRACGSAQVSIKPPVSSLARRQRPDSSCCLCCAVFLNDNWDEVQNFGAGGSSVAQHLLLSYQSSFLEIMRAQFSEKKAFSGGSQV